MNATLLANFEKREDCPALAHPDQHPNPYLRAGSHPDIVGRLWDELGTSLPTDCRALIHGTPALVHPTEGVVIALAYGTQYAIRIPADAVQEARKIGCHTEHEWTGGGKTRLPDELGPNWFFGCWAEAEKDWLTRTYESL